MDSEIEKYLPAFREQLNKWVIFNNEEWAIFSTHLNVRRLRKKEHFTQAGAICKELGFILSGALRLYHLKDVEEITSYFCLDNAFICSYKSFLKQQPGLSYIQAITDVLLITIEYNSLQQLLNNPITAHKTERLGRLMAEDLIFCYEDRVQAFVTQSPEERYTDLLHGNSRILQQIPQHYLANYLGITPVSLSRIRKRILEPGK